MFRDRVVLAAGVLLGASPVAALDATLVPTFVVQADAISIDGAFSQSAVEFRRLRPGARGSFGSAVTWVAEIDIAQGMTRVTNLQLNVAPAAAPVSLTVGQIFPPTSLETVSTQNGGSFLERAQLHDMFSFGRRLGAVAAWRRDDVQITASAFGNDIAGTFAPGNRLFALRGVWAPTVGSGRLHLAANAKWRDAGSAGTLRYGARAGSALLDTLLLNTGRVQASGDTNAGLEVAGVFGQLSFATEVQRAWLHDTAPGARTAMTAGYAEMGWYLTPGDSKAYTIGRFGRTSPKRPLGKGGVGALQASIRGDWADIGAKQRILSTSLHWTATSNVRLIAQLSRVRYQSVGGETVSDATLVGLRTHFIY